MKRIDFLNELYHYLRALSPEERNDILEDYRLHFIEGEKEGKSEEQICEELGDPVECARQYVGDLVVVEAEPTPVKKSKSAKKKKKNRIDKETRRKIFWTISFIWNIIQAIISVPTTCTIFLVAAIMVVFFCFVVPLTGSVAFFFFGFFATLSVFLLGVIVLLWTMIEIKTCINKINGEGK